MCNYSCRNRDELVNKEEDIFNLLKQNVRRSSRDTSSVVGGSRTVLRTFKQQLLPRLSILMSGIVTGDFLIHPSTPFDGP